MKDSKKLIVGVFLVVGALVFGIGLFFIGNKKETFSRHIELYAEFASLGMLQNGAKVRVAGMDAGQILDVEVPKEPEGRFRVKLRVEEKFKPLVRKNSVAIIQTEGLVGNKYIDIMRGGEQAAEISSGDTIASKEPFDFGDFTQQAGALIKTANQTMAEIKTNLDAAIATAGKVAGDADQLILGVSGDMQRITTTATRITGNLDEIVAGLRDGRGPAGRLLNDETMAKNLDQTISNANHATAGLDQASGKANDLLKDFESRQLLGQLQATLENTRQITESLNQAVSGFTAGKSGSSAANLKETISSAQTTMVNLADDTEALKHNFFLRGFFKKRGYYSLNSLTPEQYAKSNFVKGKANGRVWLDASIFATRPDGALDISPEGRARVDQAMSAVANLLPNAGMMIEGYGTPYLQARRRADALRQYLEAEFHLDPKRVGIMPLANGPPPSSGKTQWDGAAVVVLR